MTEAIDLSLKSRRLATFQRVKARVAASGQPMREDPRFLQLIDRWAEGQIELDEVIGGYRQLAGPAVRRDPQIVPASNAPIASGEDELLADLERVIGMVDLNEIR